MSRSHLGGNVESSIARRLAVIATATSMAAVGLVTGLPSEALANPSPQRTTTQVTSPALHSAASPAPLNVTVATSSGDVAGALTWAAYKFDGDGFSSDPTQQVDEGTVSADADGETYEFPFDTAGKGNATYKIIASFEPESSDFLPSDTVSTPTHLTVYRLDSAVSYASTGEQGGARTYRANVSNASPSDKTNYESPDFDQQTPPDALELEFQYDDGSGESWTGVDVGPKGAATWSTDQVVERVRYLGNDFYNPSSSTPENDAGEPVVDSINPAHGSSMGGDQVTISGHDLDVVTAVKFGDVEVTPDQVSKGRLDVTTPAHVKSTVPVALLEGDAVVARSPQDFAFESPQLEEANSVTAAPSTVTLDPASIGSVTELPSGSYDVRLNDPVRSLAIGMHVWIERGSPGAETGLAGKVIGVRDDNGTVHEVEQVPLDEALDDWEFAHTVNVSDTETASALLDSSPSLQRLMTSEPLTQAATASGSASSVSLINLNRGFLDCRRVVQHDGGYETLEPIPDSDVGFQVQFTIEDLQLNVHDFVDNGVRHYETSLSGSPRLEVVGNAEFSVKCEVAPSYVQKLSKSIPFGNLLVLKLSPDFSVTFTGAGKVSGTLASHFIIGVRKIDGAEAQSLHHFTQEPANLELGGEASVKVRAGVDASALYNGVAGLYGKFGVVGEVAYSLRTQSPKHCVTLNAYPQLEVGARLDLVFARWSQSFWTLQLSGWPSKRWCSDQPTDPDTDTVLDPNLAGGTDSPPYTSFPSTSSYSPFPPGTFESVNYGLSYYLRQDLTLPANTNYRWSGNLVVPEGVTLTVKPGVHIKLGHCYWTVHLPAQSCLDVRGGTVRFEGTADNPVIVTRLSDDSVDGDTDGIEPSRSLSGVAPLRVYDSGLLVMRHVDMRSAGLAPAGGAVSVYASTFTQRAGIDTVMHRESEVGLLVDASQFGDSGTVRLGNDGATIRRSAFNQVALSSLGPTTISSSAFLDTSIDLQHANVSFTNNRLLAGQSAGDPRVTVSAQAAGGSFGGNRTPSGDHLVLNVLGGAIEGSQYWGGQVAYALSGQVSIPDGSSLTVGGAVIKGGTGYNVYQSFPSGFQVAGSLTTTNSTLTNLNDDRSGPDTSVPANVAPDGNAWGGVTLVEGGTASLNNSSLSGVTRLEVPAGSRLSLLDSEVEMRTGHSTWITSAGSLDIRESRLLGQGVLNLAGGDNVVTGSDLGDYSVSLASPEASLQDVVMASGAVTATPVGAGASVQDVRRPSGRPLPIEVSGGSLPQDATWAGGQTYLLKDVITIPTERRLTLSPGAVVKAQRDWWRGDVRLAVMGALTADGTEASPVVITNRNDDRYGAPTAVTDNSADGSRWGGISIEQGGSVDLDWAVMAGAETLAGINSESSASFANTRFEPNSSYGNAALWTSGALTMTGSEVVSATPSDKALVYVNNFRQRGIGRQRLHTDRYRKLASRHRPDTKPLRRAWVEVPERRPGPGERDQQLLGLGFGADRRITELRIGYRDDAPGLRCLL